MPSPTQFDVAILGAGLAGLTLARQLSLTSEKRILLLERRPDGRVNRLFLTEQGRRVHDEVVPRHDELLADQFNSLSELDQRELLRLLRQIDHALERA